MWAAKTLLMMLLIISLCSLFPICVHAQAASCSTVDAQVPLPSVASGYAARLVATNLRSPRGITFDRAGRLLVVEQGHGVTALTLQDSGGSCVTERQRQDIIDNQDLNHGIALANDGQTLFVSSADAVSKHAYDSNRPRVYGDRLTFINNMAGSDHTTRTLLLTQIVPNNLIVSRGSTANIDAMTLDIESGHSQVKAFNVNDSSGSTSQDFNNDGMLLGWGLRNEVGIAEHPVTGGIWGVENSVDEMMRDGVDIHANNPGEELNFLGYLNGTDSNKETRNFGYPQCFAAWKVDEIPNNQGLQTGMQFAIGGQNYTTNDTFCREDRIAPRLTFASHMAPLDIKFNPRGTEAWMTFHGSWDRDDPAGYKVSVIQFANGEPVEPANSTSAATDIVANVDNSRCPDNCFRPVGMAWDSQGRLFFSSDRTGEIYVVTTTDNTPLTEPQPSGTLGAGASTTQPANMASSTINDAPSDHLSVGAVGVAVSLAALVAASLLL